jgi:hypothetical protein
MQPGKCGEWDMRVQQTMGKKPLSVGRSGETIKETGQTHGPANPGKPGSAGQGD